MKARIARDERGIALVLSLFLMMALSVLATSLMFLSQTETYASMNYRLMSQARYGAEAGVHRAVNFLLNSYTPPGSVSDPMTNYNMNVSPVTYNGNPVVLSSSASTTSNYPVSPVATAFASAAAGTLAAGNTNVGYSVVAKLVAMRQFSTYGGGTAVVMTWQITSDGTVTAGRTATVEVISTLEQQIVPAAGYAAFATSAGCGALSFAGNEVINSYDSSNMTLSSGAPVTQTSGGNVGTNGNLTLAGASTVDGSLYTPRTGVGACTQGAVTALTESGSATVTNGTVQLPQAVQLAPPAAPSPTPPETNVSFTKNSGCGTTPSCASSGSSITLTGGTAAAPLTLGNVTISTQGVLHLTAGYYNMNSLAIGSQGSIVIDSGPVILNVAGADQTVPIDFSSGSVTNGMAGTAAFDASMFQILYAGTGTIKLTGGATTVATVYAPNASAMFPSSNSNFYGSIIAASVSANGAAIHYDRHLSTVFFTAGNYMLSSFTWKKY